MVELFDRFDLFVRTYPPTPSKNIMSYFSSLCFGWCLGLDYYIYILSELLDICQKFAIFSCDKLCQFATNHQVKIKIQVTFVTIDHQARQKKRSNNYTTLRGAWWVTKFARPVVDPLGRPTIPAGSDHYFCTYCPSVTFQI